MEKNKGLRTGKVIKKIGWILLGIDLLFLIFLLLNKDSAEGTLIMVYYIIVVVIPLLSLGLILIFWGRYIQFKTKKSLIIALIITIIFSSFILQRIIYYMLEYTNLGPFVKELVVEKKEAIIKKELQAKNIKECNKIRVVSFLPQFFSDFFFGTIISGADKYYQEECRLRVATSFKDYTVCDKFKEIVDINACYRRVDLLREEKLEDCHNLSGIEEDTCIRGIAVSKKDKNLCNYIRPEELQRPCELDIEININDNLVRCRTLQVETWEEKEECVRDIAIETSDINLCNLLYSGYSNLQLKCFKEIVSKSKDPGICEYIGDDYFQKVCHEKFKK